MASGISQTAQLRLALPQGTTTAPPSGGTTTINPRTRLLLEGPIAATLLRLAPPNLVVNVILIAVTASIDAHFVGRLGAPALAGVSLVFPLMMLMQQIAAGRPLWPWLGNAARAVVVAGGGALVVYGMGDGLVGLAVAAAAGQLAYGAILVIAFRAGLWQRRDATAPRNTC
jgi:hypothetical protein